MMWHKLRQPYWVSLFIGIFLCIPFAINPDHTLDINIHDTYIVIYFPHLGFAALILHLLYSGTYVLMRKYRNYVLSLLHLFSVLPFFVLIFLIDSRLLTNAPRRYYTNANSADLFSERDIMSDSFTAVGVLFLIGLLAFLINIVLATAKVVRKKMEEG